MHALGSVGGMEGERVRETLHRRAGLAAGRGVEQELGDANGDPRLSGQ